MNGPNLKFLEYFKIKFELDYNFKYIKLTISSYLKSVK